MSGYGDNGVGQVGTPPRPLAFATLVTSQAVGTVVIRQGMFAVLALWCASASAETMYRCVGKSGAVAYQDYPCDSKSKMTGAAEFKPEYVPKYRPPQRVQQQAAPTTLTFGPYFVARCACSALRLEHQRHPLAVCGNQLAASQPPSLPIVYEIEVHSGPPVNRP